MESFLWLHWCVWPVLRLLTNGISSFNTTMIFCFVLLIPQPKVLDYAKIFVVCVNCTVWLLPPPPFNFRQAETLHFIDFKNTHTLYPVSVIYMYMNLQIFQIKKNSGESRFPGWVGAKGWLGIKIKYVCVLKIFRFM